MTETLDRTETTAQARGATETLAAHVSGLSFDALPGDVVHKAKLLLRDGLGNQLAASTIAEPARVVHGLMSELGGAEQATVTGYGTRLPVPAAALVNAMLGHGVELDDAHGAGLAKSGSLLVPSVMTTGEYLRCSGTETLTALVAGYEVMIRVALAVNPGHRSRGFHTTGAVGSIAAAAAAGRQFGLDAERTADVIGLGAMQSAGIQAYLDSPCMAKPFSPGKAAYNGTLAAMMVARGFTGPRAGLESREGFFNAYADGVDLSQIEDGLGTDWKVMEVGFKPHAACRYAHGPIDAAQAIRRDHGVAAEDIESITVRLCELAIRQSGRTVTPNLNAAMGSTPFGVALALLHGENGLRDYDDGFHDQSVHDAAASVELIADPDYGLMGRQAVVTVKLRDGRILEHAVAGPKGEPDLPLSDEEIEAKFLGLAELAIGRDRAIELSAVVMSLEEVDDLSTVTKILRAG